MSKVTTKSFFVHTFIILLWSISSISCLAIPVLQSAFAENCGEIDPKYSTENKGSVPWTVAILQLSLFGTTGEATFKLLQTGAIVHQYVVLTVFEVSEEGWYVVNGERVDVTNLFVEAGADSSDLSELGQNAHEQYYVDLVIPYMNPSHEKFQLVLLHLRQPLDLNGPYARQICLPLNYVLPSLRSMSEEQIPFVQGFVSGTNSASKSVGQLHLHILTPGDGEICTKKFKEVNLGKAENVSCAWQFANVEQPECGTVTKGTILSVQYRGRQYLKGLAGLISMKDNSCTLFFYDFLRVDPRLQNWLLHAITCASTGKMGCLSGECVPFEKICNHHKDCWDGPGQDEEPFMCRHLHPENSTFYCGFNDATIPLTKVCDGKRDCHSGVDELPSKCHQEGSGKGTLSFRKANRPSVGHLSKPKTAVSQCSLPQFPMGVVLSCSKDGDDVPCEHVSKGTKLKLRCSKWYVPSSRMTSVEMTCNEDGTWAPFKLMSCQAVCGRLNIGLNNQQAYISHGSQTSKAFAFPWHVALFFWDKRSKGFNYGCGGSLIENSFILTAAHCVLDSSGGKKDRRKMVVVLAAVSSVLERNSKDTGAIILGVEDFWVPPTYDIYSLSSDIALLKLNDSVEYTQEIQPVCYLNDNAELPQEGELGLVAGFGKQETGLVSESLRWAGFPVVSNEQCGMNLGVRIAASEFCAGFRNGTAVCEGDSGGGLVFKQFQDSEQSPYFIKGIVSRGLSQKDPSCSTNEVAIFTHVDSFGSWLLDKLSQLDIF